MPDIGYSQLSPSQNRATATLMIPMHCISTLL